MHPSFAHFMSMTALVVMVSACFPGPGFLQQKQGATKRGVSERENSVVTMTINPHATTAQNIAAAAGSAIESTQVTFPPGAINIAMKVSLEEASSIATAATVGQLDLDNRFLNTGTAIGVTANVNVDAVKPFSITLPLPATQLRLGDDSFATLSVLFKVKIGATGEIKTGIIPRHELVIADGFVKIETMYFGVYQAVMAEKSISAKIEAIVADTPQMKRDEKNLPALEVFGRQPVVVKKDETITLSGKNFRPTMTLAWNGSPIHKLKYISDSQVSFAVPSASALGLSTLNVTQEGTASTVSLVFQGDGSVRVGSFTPDEVCSGVTYFDLNGKQQQGSKTCSAPAMCSSDGASGCTVDGTNYKAAKLSNFVAGDIKTGITIAGVSGSATLESHANCTADGAQGCVTTATYKAANMANVTAGNIKSGVTIAGQAGDYPSATNPLVGDTATADLDAATFDAKVKSPSAFEYWDSAGARHTGLGDIDIVAANILSGVSIFGTIGIAPAVTNCVFDGEMNCITTAQYRAADTNAYTTWDIRKGKMVGGKAGEIVFYKNMIGSFDNTTAPAVAGNDVWDTVEDYNNNGAFPTTAPNGWDQATGTNWIMDSTNDGNGGAVNGICDGSEACVFKDQITGLMWAKDDGTTRDWQTAITYCDGLSYGGYTDWRLPTEKELLQTYVDGIWSHKAADRLSLSPSGYYWSSSIRSDVTNFAWVVTLSSGLTNRTDKTISNQVLCVR